MSEDENVMSGFQALLVRFDKILAEAQTLKGVVDGAEDLEARALIARREVQNQFDRLSKAIDDVKALE